MIIVIWFYYAKYYIIGSLAITLLLNKVTDKLYLPPLIINLVSVILLLFVPVKQRAYAIYVDYVPVVLTSIIMNLSIWIYRRIKYKN